MIDGTLVEGRDLTKSYGRQVALSGVDLVVGRSELVAVVGHNGAGKSTLFDIVGAMNRPDSGTVDLLIPHAEIGWCPQREIIDWSLTVEQNISLGLDMRAKVTRRERKSAVEEVCHALGLREHMRRDTDDLSGGELRRTQIARAMVGDPTLLILDEPTTGLDPDGIRVVFEYLAERRRQGGSAIISTHETSRFSGFCTRVVALSRGVKVADEARQDFMARAPGSDDLWDAYRSIEVVPA